MSRRRRTSGSLARILPALALSIGLASPPALRAQADLDAVRSEMQRAQQRLTALDYGLSRVLMQDPRSQSHVSVLKGLILNVQIDLDYLSAMTQLVDLARDADAAEAIFVGQMKGAQDRMLFAELEQEIASREQRGVVVARPLEAVEQELVDQLRAIRQLYAGTFEQLERRPR